MKARVLWQSFARTLAFGVGAAVLCRVFAPLVWPGAVAVSLAAPGPRPPLPKPTPKPQVTPLPSLSRTEQNARRRVDKLIETMRDFVNDYDESQPSANQQLKRRVRARIRRLQRNAVDIDGFGSREYEQVGTTALCNAARDYWTRDAMRLLLKLGADPNRTDEGGTSPLEIAIIDDHGNHADPEGTQVLVNAGADVNQRFSDGQTPLCAAVSARHNESALEVVALLLRAGARPDGRNAEGETALMGAVHGDGEWWTFDLAAQKRERRLLTMLLRAGASLQARDHRGRTPLMHAINFDSINYEGGQARLGVYSDVAIPLLLSRGADPNARDKSGQTALHHAALPVAEDAYYSDAQFGKVANARVRAMRLLLRAGANLEARDHQGRTALMIAMECYYQSLARPDVALRPVQFLVAQGANVNARDFQERTVLDLARREPTVTQFLRAHGARTSAEDIPR